ncbi:MAG: septal ring lytic transglycosylase RlpA family protein [Nautiliaceae bacterium]
MKGFIKGGILVIFLLGCANRNYDSPTNRPYTIHGVTYNPYKDVYVGWTQEGLASWYGPNFHGKLTSNGEIYNMYAFTAAHKTLPMGTIVKVTNLNNGKSVIVRINDRGPFVRDRIIDLSYVAGKVIGLDKTGIAPVRLKVLGIGMGDVFARGYKVQIGAFTDIEKAKILAGRFEAKGYHTAIIERNGIYKVYVVGFKNEHDALLFMRKEMIKGFVKKGL